MVIITTIMVSTLIKIKSKFIIFLLFVIFFIYSCRNGSIKGIEGDNNDHNNITIGNNNIIIQDDKNRLADSVEIVGKWSKELAIPLVLKILNDDFDSIQNNYSHKILDFYNMEYVDKEGIICVIYSKLKPYYEDGKYILNDCHSCGGELSFVEFGKYSNGWKIENKYLRNLEDGQWGEPSSNWKLMNIGYHKFGFVIEAGGTGQGYTEMYTNIYSIIGDEFKNIFSEMTGFDDSGAISPSQDAYDSNITVIKEGTGFYDIILTTKGLKNKKAFTEKNYYKFDGIKYSISNNFK